MTLLELAIVFSIGLFVGWNFIPQPQFIKDWFENIKNHYLK